ncbi:MAG: prepilin-type N-terminal cleavage/methylation domain-containing protein [Magnetococcales bacterium]|nr:prepilin-type N-terminal cleavage/methylation domain-containing protein [Magnetococcales bacterium]
MLIPRRSFADQDGISLVELMVALAAGAIVLSGVVQLFSNQAASQAYSHQVIRLNQELRTLEEMMSRELRRAGFWGTTPDTSGFSIKDNPFWASGFDLTISNITGGTANSCILFSYDLDQDGSLDTSSGNDERYGFRLATDGSGIGVVQMRRDSAGGTFSCGTAYGDTDWVDLTDPRNTHYTQVSFSLSECKLKLTAASVSTTCPDTNTINSGDPYLTKRQVTITLTGQLVSDSTISMSSTTEVWLRNDKLGVEP